MEQIYMRQKQEANLRGLEEAMSRMSSPKILKDCKFYKPGVGFLCKAKDVGLNSYIECLEIDSRTCPFSLFYAHAHYCSCRPRVDIAKKPEN